MSARLSIFRNGKWVTGGSPTTPTTPVDSGSQPAKYTDSNVPWALGSGATLLDNIPAGVERVSSSTLTSSRDVYTIFEAAAARSTPSYVQLAEDEYSIADLKNYVPAVGDWRGWTNGNRRVMGMVGAGVGKTSIKVEPTAVSSSPGARDYILGLTKDKGPAAVTAMYFSNTQTDVPMFFSGVGFDGTLQGPYGVYSAGTQAQFQRNPSVASPLAWGGIAMWAALAGSRMQYCRFRGFAYSLLNAPSFERGNGETNRSNGLVFDHVEIDGRIAAEFDASRHRASGGLMWNKDIKVSIRNSWMHHTRRSGWAINTNTGNTAESYSCDNFQVDNICGLDEFASNNAGFPGSNIEEVIGVCTYNNFYANIEAPLAHIQLNIPYSGSPGVYTMPDRPVIVSRGFRTDDTTYGGCQRIEVKKVPNSTGTSPAWTKISSLGIAGSNLFDIRRADNTPLVGVKSTDFNAAIHKPSTHFVVIY